MELWAPVVLLLPASSAVAVEPAPRLLTLVAVVAVVVVVVVVVVVIT